VASDYPFSAEFWSGNLTLPELANPMYFLAQKAVLQLLYERTLIFVKAFSACSAISAVKNGLLKSL
ncbi:MAG: hypothetical protein ACYC7L_07325, partial [Nitrospirota bacterium]